MEFIREFSASLEPDDCLERFFSTGFMDGYDGQGFSWQVSFLSLIYYVTEPPVLYFSHHTLALLHQYSLDLDVDIFMIDTDSEPD